MVVAPATRWSKTKPVASEKREMTVAFLVKNEITVTLLVKREMTVT